MTLEEDLQRQIQELSNEVMGLRERLAILENCLKRLTNAITSSYNAPSE
jgi:prefoldin subunit 5